MHHCIVFYRHGFPFQDRSTKICPQKEIKVVLVMFVVIERRNDQEYVIPTTALMRYQPKKCWTAKQEWFLEQGTLPNP